ncbi:hypothetical protein CEK25_004978 [Fusarium fujikuroi]|nr:hypothetical protein CEK25_004978 [Fusarium fujikuroi]
MAIGGAHESCKNTGPMMKQDWLPIHVWTPTFVDTDSGHSRDKKLTVGPPLSHFLFLSHSFLPMTPTECALDKLRRDVKRPWKLLSMGMFRNIQLLSYEAKRYALQDKLSEGRVGYQSWKHKMMKSFQRNIQGLDTSAVQGPNVPLPGERPCSGSGDRTLISDPSRDSVRKPVPQQHPNVQPLGGRRV